MLIAGELVLSREEHTTGLSHIKWSALKAYALIPLYRLRRLYLGFRRKYIWSWFEGKQGKDYWRVWREEGKGKLCNYNHSTILVGQFPFIQRQDDNTIITVFKIAYSQRLKYLLKFKCLAVTRENSLQCVVLYMFKITASRWIHIREYYTLEASAPQEVKNKCDHMQESTEVKKKLTFRVLEIN